MSDGTWTAEQHADGSFTIKDAGGEVRGRFADTKVMAAHFIFALQENDKLGLVVNAARKLAEDKDIHSLLLGSVDGRRLLIGLGLLRVGWKRMEIPIPDESSKDV